MTHDKPLPDDQMTRLLERSMRSVTASDDLVAAGISRGRRATRRRRAAQAAGIGAAAALATAAVVAMSALLGEPDDGVPAAASPSASTSTVEEPAGGPASPPQPRPDELAPHLQRAQELLLDALPQPVPDPGYITRVTYDPDGLGRGEVVVMLNLDASEIVDLQDSRCDRVAASSSPDDCVDTGDGWAFTGPSLPDVSGKDPDLRGQQVIYILRTGEIANLTAYNAPAANRGGEPTRTDPVLDADELVELVTRTEWFA